MSGKSQNIVLLVLFSLSVLSGIPFTEKEQNKAEEDKLRFEIILPNLYRLKDACNSYLLKSGSSAILIDAGSENISGQLKEIGVTKIDWILHTHYHRDQCLGDLKLKRMGSSIAIGRLEKNMLYPVDTISPFKISGRFLLNGTLTDSTFLNSTGTLPTKFLLNGALTDRGRKMEPFEKPGVDRELADGELFNWNQYSIRVINTPGHTEGSVSYLIEVGGKLICFTGDLLMKGGYVRDLYSMQWNYLENPGIDSSLISLQKIRVFEPDCILPSHGGMIDDPNEDIRLLTIRLKEVQKSLQFERAGRWNWSGFVQVSQHVVQDCGTTSQIIIAPDGEALMFDCGSEFTLNRLDVAKKMFGIKRIAIIIPSHWHYDHVDGIPAVADAEGTKIWVWEGLAEHLEFPERFITTCRTGRSIKADRVLSEGEEFIWGGYSFRVYHNPAHMEEQMGLSALIDGLKYFFIGDGSASNKDSHVRSALHCYNGISLATGLIKTAQSFYEADPYLCLPAHSNGFATFEDTREEFMNWAVETTDAIKALLPPAHPEMGYNPYWATFYPAKIKIKPGEKVRMALRLKNCSYGKITGKFRLKSHGNLNFDNEVREYDLAPGEIKDFSFFVKSAATISPGIYIITADILYDNEMFAEFPLGYLELEK